MRVYLDEGFASIHGGGIGRYSELVYAGLKERGVPVTFTRHRILARIKNTAIRRVLYSMYLNLIFPFVVKSGKYDIVHFTNFQVPLLKSKTIRYVSTVHDISPLVVPDVIPRAYSKYFSIILKTIQTKADVVITVSRSIQNELLKLNFVSPDKIKLCPIGLCNTLKKSVATYDVLAQHALQPKQYFLFVGRLERRKNLIFLIQAFDSFKEQTNSLCKLVLVGADGYGAEEVHERRAFSKFSKDVIVTGYVSDEVLPQLYANSLAFVFPSRYEGFGIPLLEAMLFKLPIVLSQIPTNEEMIDSRGYFFGLDDKPKLVEHLNKIEKERPGDVNYSDLLSKYSVDRMIDLHLSAYKDSGAI